MQSIAVASNTKIHIGNVADAMIRMPAYDARLVSLAGWGIGRLWSRRNESDRDTLMFLGMVPHFTVQ